MKLTRTTLGVFGALAALSIGSLTALHAQAQAGQAAQSAVAVAKLVAEPASVSLRAGESAALKVTAYDAAGRVIAGADIRVNLPRNAGTYADGRVTAFAAGTFTATAVATGATPVTLEIPVVVAWPALAKLEITAEPGGLYAGVTIAHTAVGSHADGSPRPGLVATWRTSDASVATVDRFGHVTALKAGAVTITATADGASATRAYTVTATAPSPEAFEAQQADFETVLGSFRVAW